MRIHLVCLVQLKHALEARRFKFQMQESCHPAPLRAGVMSSQFGSQTASPNGRGAAEQGVCTRAKWLGGTRAPSALRFDGG